MALIESVFKRPTSDRVLPFSIIAKETKLPSDEVEHLVMKALSYVSLPLLLPVATRHHRSSTLFPRD